MQVFFNAMYFLILFIMGNINININILLIMLKYKFFFRLYIHLLEQNKIGLTYLKNLFKKKIFFFFFKIFANLI